MNQRTLLLQTGFLLTANDCGIAPPGLITKLRPTGPQILFCQNQFDGCPRGGGWGIRWEEHRVFFGTAL